MAAETTPWDAVLFDLDGTLIDSVPLILDSFRYTFAECGLPVPDTTLLLQGVGIPLEPHFLRYVDDPVLVTTLVATYRTHNLANHDHRVSAFPGIRQMLEGVRAAGARVGVVTSKNRSTTERGLQVTSLGDLVEVIVASDEVEHPKPHPEPVLRGLTLLGASAARSLYVGDSLHDLHAGRAAGVRTVAALWGPFTQAQLSEGAPDFWVDSPSRLCAALGLVQDPRGR